VVGITDALSMPSYQSIVPSIVSREEIDRGIALNSTQFNLSRILGPSIAGVLMSGAGVMACFVASAASYVPFIGVALWILPRGTRALPPAAPSRTLHTFAEVRGIVGQRYLRGALLTVLTTSVLCSPLVTFVPVLVKQVFHGDAVHFSTAIASFGVGGLLGAAALLGIPSSVDRRRLSSGFAIVYGAALVITALNPWFFAVPVLLAIAGAAMTVSNTAANSLLQATSSPQALGLAVSLYMLAMRGGIAVGSLFTGATVSLLGVQPALFLNGIAAVAVHAALARTWFRAPLADPDRA